MNEYSRIKLRYPETSVPPFLPKSTVGQFRPNKLHNFKTFSQKLKKENFTFWLKLTHCVFSSSCLELLWKCIFSTQCISRNFAMHFIDFVNFVRCCCCAPAFFFILNPKAFFSESFPFPTLFSSNFILVCSCTTVLKNLQKVWFRAELIHGYYCLR